MFSGKYIIIIGLYFMYKLSSTLHYYNNINKDYGIKNDILQKNINKAWRKPCRKICLKNQTPDQGFCAEHT